MLCMNIIKSKSWVLITRKNISSIFLNFERWNKNLYFMKRQEKLKHKKCFLTFWIIYSPHTVLCVSATVACWYHLLGIWRAWQPIPVFLHGGSPMHVPPMDTGAWQATVHGDAKSWTQLKPLSTLLFLKILLFFKYYRKSCFSVAVSQSFSYITEHDFTKTEIGLGCFST